MVAVGDDPLGKAMRDLLGASAITKAALGSGYDGGVVGKAFEAQRRFEEMTRIRPSLLEDVAMRQSRISDLLASRPGIVEALARRQTAFDKIIAGDAFRQATERLGAFEDAIAGANRIGTSLRNAGAFERVLAARLFIGDTVADFLARRDAIGPLMERLSRASEMENAIAAQIVGIDDLVRHAASADLTRADLAQSFPDLVPALRFPTAAEVAEVDLAAVARIGDGAGEWARSTAAQIAAISIPWVRDDRPEVSIEAYAALKGMTEIVARTAPATPRTTQLVREELGDYRQADEADEAVDDVLLATTLRIGRGFDLRLSSLPMALVGHIFVPFGMAVATAQEADAEELDAAISLMFRQLERKLRGFIDAVMKAGVGERWIRQRVHKTIREEWERRLQVDVDAGRTPGDLFDYADFGDYRGIIEQGDNWREVFQPIFKVKTSIGETLGRLSVIRNPVAHVRPLTVEHLLVLRVEGNRLYRWMGEPLP
jgi:hypothetical protein